MFSTLGYGDGVSAIVIFSPSCPITLKSTKKYLYFPEIISVSKSLCEENNSAYFWSFETLIFCDSTLNTGSQQGSQIFCPQMSKAVLTAEPVLV